MQVAVNTSIGEVNDFLDHIVSSTNMRCAGAADLLASRACEDLHPVYTNLPEKYFSAHDERPLFLHEPVFYVSLMRCSDPRGLAAFAGA